MKSPILGGDSVSRSKNLADNQLWNLYFEVVETRDGHEPGALYGTPGLDLEATAGIGPIRPGGMSPMAGIDGIVYLVSGIGVYTLDTNYNLTQLGSLPNPLSSPVSMVNNGRQMIIFDGVGGYLVPGGFPLTGGTIAGTMTSYAVGDDIILGNSDGTSNATAQVTVTGASGGAVTSFDVSITGAFNPAPTSFTQASTTGSGSGFQLTSPTYGTYQGVYTVPLPFSNPGTGVYIDGFGLVGVNGTNQNYQSALNDLSIWPALDFSSADATPDDIVSVYTIHREAWFIKEKHVEIWVNAGQAGYSFQRLQGVFIEVGCVAPFSPAKAGESLIWLSKNSEGQGVVVKSSGYSLAPISTQAMANELQNYSTLSDAISYVYQQNQHVFYVITFPSANTTWCYDVTASALTGTPQWARRSAFNSGEMNRHWGNAYVNFNGAHLIGDYRNGNIYSYNLENYTDNGNPRKWLRSWRATKEATLQPIRYSALQINMETGINVPAGTNPQCVLRASDDDGHTFPITRIGSVGKTGQTGYRVKFNRLGSTRRGQGLDRLFELSSTDQFGVAIIGAEID